MPCWPYPSQATPPSSTHLSPPKQPLLHPPTTSPVPSNISQVLKVGTSSLVDPEQSRFNLSAFARIVETVKRLHEMGAQPGMREAK
eukprot:366559-Chlamydomonas_euryale.AAC.11